ncbi:MAG: DUF1501 domain-containing protein, partial [Planctomycetales bacterium]|nr:DUF1501 domain-containing protein [Planctomycetales bacterium]
MNNQQRVQTGERFLARRDLLKGMAAAQLAAWSAGAPVSLQAADRDLLRPTADACILLWMAGGMASPDTFDPKRFVPFEPGLEVAKMLSTFPAINTTVDGIRFCEGLENIASVMDRGTLIRSAVQPDLGSILHSR